jgi:hypothetical protein
MTEWSHLPNATHIDQVLTGIPLCCSEFIMSPVHGKKQVVAPAVLLELAELNTALNTAFNTAFNTIWSMGRIIALDAALDVARDVARDTPREAWRAAVGAIMALIAYDHSDRYMTVTADELQVWAALSDDSAGVLLLPYVTFLEHATPGRLA